MAEVQTPLPAEAVPSAKADASVDKDALITRLDTLLEQYLNTLDEYEKLMQQLAKQLSSGYFSLTQANFHNRSGVHYGQDSYDERVQATRKVAVNEGVERRLRFSAVSILPSPAPNPSEASQDDEEEAGNDKKQYDEVEEEEPKDQSTKNEPKEKTDATEPKAVDPIRMFGILVPPVLRSAQAAFRDAVDGPVMRLAAVTGQLRALERDIGRARKAVRKA